MTVKLRNILFSSAAAITLIAGCDNGVTTTDASAPNNTAEAATQEDQTQAINAWFEAEFERQVARSPMYQTFLGRKTNYDKWSNASD